MTLIINVTRNDYILSLTDRRTTIQRGNRFDVRDERVNKHVWIAVPFPDKSGRFHRLAVTYTGVAEWRGSGGKSIPTDQIIGTAIEPVAKSGGNVGTLTQAICASLLPHFRRARFGVPAFTFVLAGFSEIFREPWIAVVTTGDDLSDFHSTLGEQDLVLPDPFRGRLIVPEEPLTTVRGAVSALAPGFEGRIKPIVQASGAKPYDLARALVREIRVASAKSDAVGPRISGIVLPANGAADLGLWDLPGETQRTAIPRMVFPNGRQWEPSEPELDYKWIGRPQWHALAARLAYDGKVPKRIFKALENAKHLKPAPTMIELIGYTLFGEEELLDGRASS